MSELKPPSESDPILVWGAGAIGGTMAAYLARAGIPVKLVDVVEAHVEACRTTGLGIHGAVDTFTQVIPAATPGELEGAYSRILRTPTRGRWRGSKPTATPGRIRNGACPRPGATVWLGGGASPRSTHATRRSNASRTVRM